MASEAKAKPGANLLTQEQLRERLLSPWPKIGLRSLVVTLLLLLVLVWALEGTNASPSDLLSGIPNIVNFVLRLFPPQFDIQATSIAVPTLVQPFFGETLTLTLPRAIPYLIETLQMAIIGTLLGIVLSFPFGLLAARNIAPHPWVYQATRMFLNIDRAIPDIIFALIFVAAVGLGPFGGVLALAFGSIGSLAKLYAESFEQIDPQQVLAVRATGASNLQAFIYGVAPQAMPLLATYSLLLFEHNVRSATILGLVGAGGIGFILTKYISLFQYRELMGALIFIIIMVTIIDRSSDYFRKKII